MTKAPLPISVMAALGMAGIAAVFLFGAPPQPQLRPCGHPRDLLWEINPFRATHCCTSGRAVNHLATFYTAQTLYRREHGQFAISFEQLTNEFFLHPIAYAFHFEGDGSRWSVSMPQQATLAGSYLLSSNGKLHFSTKGPATTNDIVLRDLVR